MQFSTVRFYRLVSGLIWAGFLMGVAAQAEENQAAPPMAEALKRLREEGLNHSQVMDLATYVCDVIGPRLTGSPSLKRANEWTRDKMTALGLTNAHLEAWGPFGTGWSLTEFSAQVLAPYAFPLIAAPKAWSPGLAQRLTAEAVYVEARNQAELEPYKGQLKGKLALISSPREVKPSFDAPAVRLTEADLLRLANAGESGPGFRGPRSPARIPTNAPPRAVSQTRTNQAAVARVPSRSEAPTNAPPRAISSNERFQFAAREGAALIVSCSPQGDGGTFFVASATVPSRGSNAPAGGRGFASPWATNAGPVPPQMVLAVEDYNRLLHLIQNGAKPRLGVAFQAQFHTNDLMAYNTVAEIPGGDLKEEVVMLGAHLDSWHAGTGATDNAAGVVVVMEAARIIKKLQLQPRRTIRVGLWTGEEQGLLGSRAYVSAHFGYYTNLTNSADAYAPKDERAAAAKARPQTTRKLVRARDYDRLSAYFNYDNGTGKIRGIYLQGNEAARPLFRKWLEPFRDLGAETITLANTYGTDHLPFDGIGLPGFQFIQDPVDYMTRTHHSNADVLDRLQADDLKQSAVIMAAFAYQAAMLDTKVPRKPERKAD
jgi:hypothetical protein